MSEKFSLKWNDFQTNISKSFGILRQEKDFFDVTLISDDETEIPGHKVVLSACSDFFKFILKRNSHSHPLLYLSGIHSTNLKLVMDYIYQGECQVYQDHLDSFLEVAQKLKIEGLVNGAEDTGKLNVKENEGNSEIVEYPNEDSYFEEKVIKPRQQTQHQQPRSEKIMIMSEEHEDHLGKEDGVYYCKVCDYQSRKKTNVTMHIETHLDGLSYSCPLCEKTFRSRNSLNNHKSVYHR